MKRLTCEHKLYLSYSQKNEKIVHKVACELYRLNYCVLIDIYDKKKLYSDVERSLLESEVVLCFISKEYCESKYCLREITYADLNDKKIIPIILDGVQSNGIGFLISTFVSFDAYIKPNTFDDETFEAHFQKLIENIMRSSADSCLKCSELLAIESKKINFEHEMFNNDFGGSVGQSSEIDDVTYVESIYTSSSNSNINSDTESIRLSRSCKYRGNDKVIEPSNKNYTTLIEKVDTLTKNGSHKKSVSIANNRHEHRKTLKRTTKTSRIKSKNIFLAAEYGLEDCVQYFLSKVDVNSKDEYGETSIYIASYYGKYEVVELLLESNANINVQESKGYTSLYISIMEGHEAVAELLLKNNADVNLKSNDGSTALQAASLKGFKNIVELILKKTTDINDSNKDGASPLYFACQERHVEVVELLLKHKPNVNKKTIKDFTPLFVASQSGYTEIVDLLLKNNANTSITDHFQLTPLYIACEQGRTETVKLLLKNNANTNLRTNTNSTALHIAVNKNHFDIVHLLLENHADANIVANIGWTALHIAAHKGYYKIVDLLLKNRANVNRKTKYENFTALFIAVFMGHIDVVELLLENKADVNIQTNCYRKPLHAAIEQGHIDIQELLINNNAVITAASIKEMIELDFNKIQNNNVLINFEFK